MSATTALHDPFDVEKEEGTPPRELLPGGRYKAEVTGATTGPTKNGRGHAVNLTWTIVEGDYEKRLVFQSILLQHESAEAQKFGRQKFKDVCTACGVTGSITDLDVLLYKTCVISIHVRKDKSGEYPDKNEIARVLPVVSWNCAKPVAGLLKAASTTPKAFEAVNEKMNDDIPF